MKLSARFILVAFLFFIFYFLFSISFAQTPTPTSRVDLTDAFGTGDNDHDGTLDATTTVSGTTNANSTKTYLTDSASAGQEILRVTNTSGFNSKDEVAIIQMQGANVGVWETAYVVDVRSAGGKGALLLNRELTNTFTVSSSPVAKIQVVKIPHYNNLTVASGGVLTTSAWDGNSGGVLFARVKNNFTVEAGAVVDVSGAGFRGGTGGSGVSMQCGDYMYCSAGTSCWPYSEDDSVIYECRADRGLRVSDPNGEGPQGVGGRSGATGNQGWGGDTRMSGGGGSRQYYVNGGGGGGGAGGGGAGGSLASSTSANGQDGGSGSYGGAATGGCYGSGTPTRETYSTGETILRYYYWSGTRSCMNECKKFESNGETLYSTDFSCSRNYTYYSAQYGPPGRGRPGGAGGTSNAVPDFSGNKILLGTGGGAGGAGAIGGSGGGGVIGGYPGTGGSGGYGGGAVVIFAKTINIAGEILSSGRGGQPGTNGGEGARGYNYGCNGDCAGGGGGGGAGGGGGGGGSGGTIRLYGETANLGADRVKALGAVGAASGGGGAGGEGGYSNAGSSLGGGTGGGSSTGGTGSNGAVFVTYTNSFSGSNSNPNPNIQANQVANITKQ